MFIGNFKPVGDNYTGIIRTLTVKIEAVFEPIERKNDTSPKRLRPKSRSRREGWRVRCVPSCASVTEALEGAASARNHA